MKKILLVTLCALLASCLLPSKEAAAFTCGPHLKTYTVSPLDNRSGAGVRCVLFSNSQYFSWYGEGQWGGYTYRHVGQSVPMRRGSVGYASDINGNGEQIHNNFPGNLTVNSSGGAVPNKIFVRGAWNEVWTLEANNQSDYQSTLPVVRTCGSYLKQYHVRDLSSQNRPGEGVRCVLTNTPAQLSTWYGDGNWYGSTYAHLGMNTSSGYGASDICEPSRYTICNTFNWGSLILTPVGANINVSGSWAEAWVP